ncbi:MAG: DMT family transporter [Acidobacteriia bacterium]|jgi:drug/metabolite transporter (DMT)-like permease|nr:DMT family transporter [Terriglobia bacterium]
MSQRLKADLALAFCSLIWGATFVVVKNALEDASVFVFLAVRFGLATLLMGAFYLSALRRLSWSAVWAGVQIGVFMFAGYAFQTVGLRFTTPTKAGFITGFGVVLVPVLLAVFWKRRIHRWAWVGALLALVGLYYLTLPGSASGSARVAGDGLNLGDVLVFFCAVLFALHIIFVGFYSPHHSVRALSFLQIATTFVLAIALLPVLTWTGWEPPRIAWTPNFIFAVLVTAVGATAIAFSIQVWAQRHTSPTHTAILFALEPVFAALTSFVVLGERLGGRGLLGAGLILAGILLAELKGPAPAAPESSAPPAPAA